MYPENTNLNPPPLSTQGTLKQSYMETKKLKNKLEVLEYTSVTT